MLRAAAPRRIVDHTQIFCGVGHGSRFASHRGEEAEVSERLLEREGELARLGGLVRAAAEGRGGWIAVAGPAGIGKTSLLEAARRAGEAEGMRVLAARGGELEGEFAYGVARDLLERPLRRMTPDDRAAVLEGAAAHAASALGLGAAAEGEAPFAVVHGLYWTCANLAGERPLLLLVDDLHWADLASIRFLSYLGRRAGELPIALVTAARPPVDAARRELLAAVESDAEIVAPRPLTAGAVAELVRRATGRDAAPGEAERWHRESAGNPFLCLVAAHAADEWTGTPLRAVTRLIGRLPPESARLVRAVAVLGSQVSLRHAAALAGLATRDAAEAHGILSAQGILRLGLPLELVHPLMRAAVLGELPAGERALLHARAARILHTHAAAPEAVATHLLAAEPAGEAWAARALRSAARDADTRGDPAAAAVFLRRALDEPMGGPDRAACLLDLGAAELRGGRPGDAVTPLAEACGIATGAQRVRCLRLLASAQVVLGRFVPACASLEAALQALPPGEDLALELEAEIVQMASIDPPAYAAARERVERPRRHVTGRTRGERALLASLTTSAFFALRPASEVREVGLRTLRAGLFDDHREGSVVWNNVAYPLIFSDAGDLIAEAADEAVAEAARRGSVVGAVRAHAVRAMLHLRRGELRDAIADARVAATTGHDSGILLAALALGVLVEALAAHGDLLAADAALEELGLEGPVPGTFHENWALHGRGWLRLAQDRAAEAAADFEELGRRRDAWNPALFRYRSGLALARLRLGDVACARDAADEELGLARRWGTRPAVGIALRAAGLAHGDLDALRASVAELDGSGAALEHARSLVELGAALRRAGRRSASREPLAAGMELAHRCAAAPLAARAREELVATGARPRRAVRTGADALTPSELRVARMAAGGMTNRAIAQALFVTTRTVETHLTHAYGKLGIASREELDPALQSCTSLPGCATAPAEGCRSG